MIVTKHEAHVLSKFLQKWKEAELLDEETARKLSESLIVQFDWIRLARYAAVLALLSLLISAASLISDPEIAFFIQSQPAWSRASLAGIFSAIFFILGIKIIHSPYPLYTICLNGLGCLLAVVAITQFVEAVNGNEHLLNHGFLLLSVCLFILGWYCVSRMIWFFAYALFASWIGMETGYLSGYGAYFLGMNYPLRFLAFGLFSLAISMAFAKQLQERNLATMTLVLSLLFLFLSLWMLSLFGMRELGHFRSTSADILFWSLVMGIACISAIIFGCKNGNRIFSGFGLTFFAILLFTKYFEFFWDAIHKSVFFAVLALVCLLFIRYYTAIQKRLFRKLLS